MKKSEFGKISGTDLLNALYHATIATGTLFVGIMSQGQVTKKDAFLLGSTFLGSFIGSISKHAVTNSDGSVLKKE